MGLPPGDTDPMLDGISDSEPDFDEPQELADMRARLAALTASQGVQQAASVLGHVAPPAARDQAADGVATEDDARDYFESVRDRQAMLDAGGPALMASNVGDVARLAGVRAAGDAALAALDAADREPAAAAALAAATYVAAAVVVPSSEMQLPPVQDERTGVHEAEEQGSGVAWGSAEPSELALSHGLRSSADDQGPRRSGSGAADSASDDPAEGLPPAATSAAEAGGVTVPTAAVSDSAADREGGGAADGKLDVQLAAAAVASDPNGGAVDEVVALEDVHLMACEPGCCAEAGECEAGAPRGGCVDLNTLD